MASNQKKRGYTLIELMIVVAIIGVLAAVAIAGYRMYVHRARNAEAVSLLASIRIKQEAYRATFHQYCDLSDKFVPDLGSARLGFDKLPWVPTNQWRQLGVNVSETTVMFQYWGVAGIPGGGGNSGDPSNLTARLPAGHSFDMTNDFWYGALALSDFDLKPPCQGFAVYSGNSNMVRLDTPACP